ncbi:MAG: DEAD/DEAH box helicase, partial [Spirochaetes bacterium]|nr:DEAD/DEAH box helicase [Spirochaetota bacterium]
KYEITIRDFEKASGYCSCKDFKYNKLGTCKHLIFAHDKLNIKHQEATKEQKVNYPYIELYCDPLNNYQITYYHNQSEEANEIVESMFGKNNNYLSEDSYPNFLKSINKYQENKKILIRNEVNEVIDKYFENTILANIEREHQIDFFKIKANLYDYQKEGIKYSIYKKGAIIADEMGLGKTIQAIAVALSKQEIFDFKRCLIICPASLKEQWKKEIEKFTDEKAIIVEGDRFDRKKIYQKEKTYFLITNYEAVLRDVTILQNFPPDFMILDEAQRIKNYETKTAEAVKSIPKKHSLVITGTPLENNLSELYSIMQFVDPHLLTPLWEFSMNHCLFDKSKKNKITGYYNLLNLKKRLQSIVIRREKREVLNELPPIQENNVPVELSREQAEIHLGYAQAIM